MRDRIAAVRKRLPVDFQEETVKRLPKLDSAEGRARINRVFNIQLLDPEIVTTLEVVSDDFVASLKAAA